MRTVLSAVLLSLFAFASARAQGFELSVMGLYPRFSRAKLGSADTTAPATGDTKLTGQYGYGARISLNTKGYYGFELGYTHSRANLYTIVREAETEIPTTLQDRIVVQQAFLNFLAYMMPAGERWRPFITGGVQAAQYAAPHLPQWPGGGSRNYGANFGGGLKLLLAKHLVIRWDVRDFIGGKPYKQLTSFVGGHGHNLEGSMGVGVAF